MTQVQIDAARRNGAKSKGPKTPEGKAISCMNALRTGMTAKAVLLTNEDPAAFHKLTAAYYEKFQPADDVERDIVDEMVIAKWRQRRDWSNEAALFDVEMDNQTKKVDSEYKKIDHACRFALAFRALADESKALQLAARYETTHRRAYYKALSALLQLRAQPKPAPDPVQPSTPTQIEPATGLSPSQGDEVASQNAHPTAKNNFCETNPRTPNPHRATMKTNAETEQLRGCHDTPRTRS